MVELCNLLEWACVNLRWLEENKIDSYDLDYHDNKASLEACIDCLIQALKTKSQADIQTACKSVSNIFYDITNHRAEYEACKVSRLIRTLGYEELDLPVE